MRSKHYVYIFGAIIALLAVLSVFGCKTVKEFTEDKTVVKIDSSSTTETVETIDTTATLPADTTSLNNLPVKLLTDTTDTTPLIFDNDKGTVIIKRHKKTFDVVIIRKEQKVPFKFTRKTKTSTRLKKTEKATSKTKVVKTDVGPVYLWGFIIGGIVLLLLLLFLYYLYRRYKNKIPFL